MIAEIEIQELEVKIEKLEAEVKRLHDIIDCIRQDNEDLTDANHDYATENCELESQFLGLEANNEKCFNAGFESGFDAEDLPNVKQRAWLNFKLSI